MGYHIRDLQHYEILQSTATHVLELLSNTIDVNTFFLSTNDKSVSVVVKAFNREAEYFKEGSVGALDDVL